MTSALRWAAMTENHFNVSVGSDGQSHKPTVSTNHNLFEEKGEPKRRYRTEVLPLTSLGNALPLGQTGSQRLMHWGSVKVPCWVSHALSSMFIIIQRISRARLLVQCEPIRFGRPASGDTGSVRPVSVVSSFWLLPLTSFNENIDWTTAQPKAAAGEVFRLQNQVFVLFSFFTFFRPSLNSVSV